MVAIASFFGFMVVIGGIGVGFGYAIKAIDG